MKKILFVLLFFSIQLIAQEQANFWYFGNNAGIDFSSGEPVSLDNGKLETDEGCSTISDKEGNLLFYTDGSILYDKNHDIMTFSDGSLANSLGGNASSTQSGLFVPNPTDENIYYLFTVGTEFVPRGEVPNPGYNFYTIDKSKNSGFGEVVDGPVNLALDSTNGNDLSNTISEKITAVQADCNNIWVVNAYSDRFYSYKITESGVDNLNPVVSNNNYLLQDKRGYMKISPDGTKLALADYSLGFNISSLLLYDFNVETGEVSSSFQQITNSNSEAPYGIEFSQQSNKLYALYTSTSNVVTISQFDLTSSNISSSRQEIYREQNAFRGALQLGPDGKIYVSIPDNSFLSSIDDINSDTPIFERASVRLTTGTTAQGLPPFIQSFFAPVNLLNNEDTSVIVSNGLQELCEDESLEIEPELETTLTDITYSWTKENDSSVNFDTRNITIDNTLGSGTYLFEAVATDECGREQTYLNSLEVIFYNKPIINTIPVFTECDFDSNTTDFITNFVLSSKETQLYTGTENVSIDFFETDDTTFSTPLDKNVYRNRNPTDTSNHQLTVRVTNDDSGCFQTSTIELKVNSTASFPYGNEYLCELDEGTSSLESIGIGKSTFNFDEKTNEIIDQSSGALNNIEYNFDYYLSQEDASLQVNKITAPYEELYSNDTDIFVRVSLKATNDCESVGQFKIFINELPIPQGSIDPLLLCISNPIPNPQPDTIALNADTGIATDTYKWYLNDDEIIGETSAVLDANESGIYKVESYREYENDITDNSDDTICLGYNTFTVFTSNEPIIEKISFLDNQDDLVDNTITVEVSGIGEYEYSLNSTFDTDFEKGLNNLTYTFTNVPVGLNIIYVRDTNGCGITSASDPIPFLYFQRHFTPNGDGKFDVWQIQGVDTTFFTSINYQIFDRYGKLIQSNNQLINNGWDGNLNGKPLPPDDYWYNIILVNINGNVIKKTGHFSLIRDY
ncbi:T9SS type B sorting domain-containing protein [Polaribacter sp.]|nr:T9SS type B sorting domain-containing protein [Polaribacter sp.]